ncbi:MAG: hypothetical protein IPI30_06575 [Saprospiraceae bacterium]|nr:hypothetical protein [Candidatus Vicinibacter affinis]
MKFSFNKRSFVYMTSIISKVKIYSEHRPKLYSMIKAVKGDIMLSDDAVFVHSVPPMDHFDSGLALSIRDQYPEMVKEFRHHCRVHHPSPGEIFNWIGKDGKQIVSLMAQEPPPSSHGHAIPVKRP